MNYNNETLKISPIISRIKELSVKPTIIINPKITKLQNSSPLINNFFK